MKSLVDYQKFAKELKEKRESLPMNKADLSFNIKANFPGIRISPATISRVEKLEQKDLNYSTAYYWNRTLEILESQKNNKNLATGKSNKSSAKTL